LGNGEPGVKVLLIAFLMRGDSLRSGNQSLPTAKRLLTLHVVFGAMQLGELLINLSHSSEKLLADAPPDCIRR